MAIDNLGFGASKYGGNPYLDDTINSTLGDMQRVYQNTTAPQMASAQAASGSFGNSGLQAQQDYTNRNFANALGQTAGNMRSNDYWTAQNFNRANYNDTFNQNQTQLQNMNALIGNAGTMNAQDQTNATNIQNTPMNYWQQFAQGANAIAGQGGSTTQNQQATGSPLMGALGGWQLGSQMNRNLGFGGGVQDNGYSSGTGSAYGGYVNNGQFTPYRAGM